jgi:malate dehydrogenase (oxaloacetate-decarboxylating)
MANTIESKGENPAPTAGATDPEIERFAPEDAAPSYVVTMRVELENRPGAFALLASEIANQQGNLGAVDIVSAEARRIVRDINVQVSDEEHSNRLIKAVRSLPHIHLVNVSDQIFNLHRDGKIEIAPKFSIKNRTILSQAYTPGVARVCKAIHRDPRKAHQLTIKRRSVAIVTDGSAVLDLGNLGPLAALPVMEGKAMLFKEFADINAFPICLDTQTTDGIVQAVKAIAPVFGAINLEDIAAPRCFEVEQRLRDELDIPVFHDDRVGAAIVVLAALRNALRVVKKPLEEARIVIGGAGSGTYPVAKILARAGARHIVACDRHGALTADRLNDPNLSPAKLWLIKNVNRDERRGTLEEVLKGADVFIGLSLIGNPVPEEGLRSMAGDAIVFALGRPQPEVMPEVAWRHAKVVATSRSDYPNQISNLLVFPGLFQGALDTHAKTINEEMMSAAAEALAEVVGESELCADYIVPSVFNPAATKKVAKAVAVAALRSGASKPNPPSHH